MAGKGKKNIKKAFFDVKVPMISTLVKLYGAGEEELIGKVITIDLTKSLRGKSFILKMKVVKDSEGLKGVPFDISLAGSYIRRMIRKGTDYVEDSFIGECRDTNVKIKPFLITRKKVSRSIRGMLRDNANKFILGYVKTRTADEIISEIITNKLQKQLSIKLKKIYPLAMCDIRVFELLNKENKVNAEAASSNAAAPAAKAQ
jgi:ribosomal protein S3AE